MSLVRIFLRGAGGAMRTLWDYVYVFGTYIRLSGVICCMYILLCSITKECVLETHAHTHAHIDIHPFGILGAKWANSHAFTNVCSNLSAQ